MSYTADIGARSVAIQNGPFGGDTAPTDIADADPSNGHQIPLNKGLATVIYVNVAAESDSPEADDADADDWVRESYKITVYRDAEASSDATLQSLTLSGITLSPAFNPGTTAYTAEVEGLESTTVEAMPAHPDATVEGAGMRTLVAGENVISVTVTADDDTTTETYTVTVTRAAEAGMDASLTSLSLMDGMGMDVTLVAGVAAHWNTLDCPAMNDRVGADDEPDDMTSPYCRMYDGLDDAAKMVVDATYDEDPIEGFRSDINMYYASAASDVEMIKVMATAP